MEGSAGADVELDVESSSTGLLVASLSEADLAEVRRQSMSQV